MDTIDTLDKSEESYLSKNKVMRRWKQWKNSFSNRSQLVDILSIFFGIGSWIGINATFCQVPVIVKTAPEAWKISSYLVLTTQLGNIGPFAYTIFQKFSKKKLNDANLIYVLLVIGSLSSILVAFLYDKTTYVGNKEYSLPLFIFVYGFALVGCTSSVLLMPYMGRFREIYLITYLVGEGLSGLIVSIVALIQGVGGNEECRPTNTTTPEPYVPPPLFDTTSFFIFVFCLMICSFIAFMLLDKLKMCKQEYAIVQISHGNDYDYNDIDDENTNFDNQRKQEVQKKISPSNYKLVMILMAMVSVFGNGVAPAIQSFSCLPYGYEAFHLAVTLSSIAHPIACILAMFLPHSSIRSIVIQTGISMVLTAYIIVAAALSPSPPFVNTTIGQVLIVGCWTIFIGLISYLKLCVTSVMRAQGGKSLVWTGFIGQIGSATGSIITFALVNYTTIFKSYEPCT